MAFIFGLLSMPRGARLGFQNLNIQYPIIKGTAARLTAPGYRNSRCRPGR
jgi:hypothetical protein